MKDANDFAPNLIAKVLKAEFEMRHLPVPSAATLASMAKELKRQIVTAANGDPVYSGGTLQVAVSRFVDAMSASKGVRV